MTDLYALLKQSIIERDIRDVSDREAVYAQARQAIVKQLWAFRPPLAADEIDTRVGAYDLAVERMEKDLQAVFANGSHPVREKPGRRPSISPPEPEQSPDVGDEEEVVAPPLSEWRHDDADEPPMPEVPDDDAAYESGVPRASPARNVRRAALYRGDDDLHEEAEDATEYLNDDQSEDDAEDVYEERYGARDARDERRRASDALIEPARDAWRAFTDRHKVQMLAGAIAALIIALVGFGAYLYLSRDAGGGVTVDIGVRREVSDAATAARIATDAVEVVQTYTLFEGRDPTIFATTPDNPVHFVSDEAFARASSSASAPGVKAFIGPGLAERLAGRTVRVTLVVRSSTDNGAATMRFAYQSGVAVSHWQTANLEADYQAVGMIWRVPTMRTSATGDYLLIEPGIPGDGTGVDIQSIKIDVLAREDS